MCTTYYFRSRRLMYRTILLFLATVLLGGCSRAHQLGMKEEDLQGILDAKLNNPDAALTSNQSIALVNYCAVLGEQNAANAADREVTMVLGNTGVGKSTIVNYLMGCAMKLVKPSEVGLEGRRRVVVVAPTSPRPEVMSIGHGDNSHTFMPKLVLDSDEGGAYCDCPGFGDSRGAEINIANAINIRKVLQQAGGLKALLLVEYSDLTGSRGSSRKVMEAMCLQMFGGIDNLKKHQDAVLLGITKAPLYEDDEPLTRDLVHSLLIQSRTSVTRVLANRFFLFDPLDRGGDNPDFWSRERCRDEIAQLSSISKQDTEALFQTVLTDNDQTKLKLILRERAAALAAALEGDDYQVAGSHWKSLARLRIIGSDEVEMMIREHAGVPLAHFVLRRYSEYKDNALQYKFDAAENQLALLRTLLNNFPNERLECSIEGLEAVLRNSKEKKRLEEESIRNNLLQAEQEAARKALQEADVRLKQEVEKHKKELEERVERERNAMREQSGSGCCTIS
jgi:energy-coupling factor transporter ATP-binding protein EcfA2